MTSVVQTAPEVRAATRAVYAAFILAGVATASWASRIPQVRDQLGLTPSRLGLVLLSLAAGSIVSLLMAGQIVARFGSSRTVAAMGGLLGVALLAVSIGYEFGVLPVVLALFGFGFANGAWDVAMNVQGAVVERRLGKAIMPRFHAGFSIGTVAGARVGAGAGSPSTWRARTRSTSSSAATPTSSSTAPSRRRSWTTPTRRSTPGTCCAPRTRRR